MLWCKELKNWGVWNAYLSSFHNKIQDKADLEGKSNIISLLMDIYFNNLVSNDAT